MHRLEQYIKHPVSGLTHLLGAFLSLIGLIVLMTVAQGKPWHLTSFLIYGITLILLYLSSSLYHMLHLPREHEERLLGLDRAAIYMLIAGTYTPICMVVLPRASGQPLLATVWILAGIGIGIDILCARKTPDWLQALLYLVTGWIVVFALQPLFQHLAPAALAWLGAGSLVYTVGAVICVMNRPNLNHRFFNAHDLWHVMVMAGSACHFIVMFQFVAHH